MIRVISSFADGPVNFHSTGPAEDQIQKLISSTGTCWGTLHSEKVVWNKNKSCYRYKLLLYFIKFTYDNELYI